MNITTANALPQKLASGVSGVLGNLTGAEYGLLLYVGTQVVNGVNHLFIARQTLTTLGGEQHLVKLIIHEKDEKFALSSIEVIV